MNGPLLISLLPPERIWNFEDAIPGYTPFVSILLLIGFLLSYCCVIRDDDPFPDRQGATVGKGVEAEDGTVKNLKWRELLGRYIFGLQETE
jgi:hypothetical protein